MHHYILDFYSGTYDVYDINGIKLASHINNHLSSIWYQYRVESKYRYSGLLYDKLRCLFSYIYRNDEYRMYNYQPIGKYVFNAVHRFNTRHMITDYINVYENTYNDSLLKNLYFIES